MRRSSIPSANSPFPNKVTFISFRGYDKAIYLVRGREGGTIRPATGLKINTVSKKHA